MFNVHRLPSPPMAILQHNQTANGRIPTPALLEPYSHPAPALLGSYSPAAPILLRKTPRKQANSSCFDSRESFPSAAEDSRQAAKMQSTKGRQKDVRQKNAARLRVFAHVSVKYISVNSFASFALCARISGFAREFTETVPKWDKSCHANGFPAEFAGSARSLRSARLRQTGVFWRQSSAKSAKFGTGSNPKGEMTDKELRFSAGTPRDYWPRVSTR